MTKSNIERAKSLDWSKHASSLPKEGVLYPKGQDRSELIARMEKAFKKANVRQTA